MLPIMYLELKILRSSYDAYTNLSSLSRLREITRPRALWIRNSRDDIAASDDALKMIAHVPAENSYFLRATTASPARPQNLPHIQRTLRREPPRDFSPPAFPTKVRKLGVGDFEVVRGQASLTAEAQGTRLFCSAESQLLPRVFPSPSLPARFPFPPRSRRDPSRGRLRRRTPVLFILRIPNTRRRAALYYNLLTDVIITILYK